MSEVVEVPQKEGLLIKQGHVRKNWLKRNFVLQPNCHLAYYNSSKSKQRGLISLKNYTVQEGSSYDIKKPPTSFIIHLVPQELNCKEFFLCTTSHEDLMSWIAALKHAAEEGKRRARIAKKMEDSSGAGTSSSSFTASSESVGSESEES